MSAEGSLVQQAMAAVTDHMRRKALRVGESLPGEAWFATELKVSRPVMREAFGALAALGVVDVANGRRPRVGAVDGAVIARSLDHAVSTAQISVAEVWDVRRTMELRTASLAAERRTAEEASEISRLAGCMAGDLDDLGDMTVHDIAFHEAIARASHNVLFTQIVSSFAPLMALAVPTAWATRTTADQRRVIIECHLAVAQAIAQGDPIAAEAAMDAHFDSTVGDLLQADGAIVLRGAAS